MRGDSAEVELGTGAWYHGRRRVEGDKRGTGQRGDEREWSMVAGDRGGGAGRAGGDGLIGSGRSRPMGKRE